MRQNLSDFQRRVIGIRRILALDPLTADLPKRRNVKLAVLIASAQLGNQPVLEEEHDALMSVVPPPQRGRRSRRGKGA